jgi:Fe-S cluster biogenesis protein NfuA
MIFRSTVLRSRVAAGLTRHLAKSAPATTEAASRSLHHLAAAASPHSSPEARFPQQKNSSIDTQFRTVFVQTENTPNPESIKFVPSGKIVLESEDGTGYFVSRTDAVEDIMKSPLCKELFKIDGVKAVYLGYDFVTITKYAEHKWQLMRPEIFGSLMDFFGSNQPVLLDKPLITDTTILDDDDEIVAMIKELIESRIRPAVQEDGGDIRYVSFDETTGLVTVQLAGSCVGCPSSSITLKNGVENMLVRRFILREASVFPVN